MRGLTQDERRDLLLSVGTHKGKRRLTPIECAVLFEKAKAHGMTMGDIAEAVQLTSTMVGRFLKLLPLASELRHLVDFDGGDGPLKFTSAFELARLPSPGDQAVLAEACLSRELSSAEVRQVVQLVLRSGRPVGECASEVVGMRPTVVTRHVYIGAILLESLRKVLGARHQAERNELLRSALDESLPDLKVSVARLGADRFTLVGDERLGAAAKEGLEDKVNAALLSRIA